MFSVRAYPPVPKQPPVKPQLGEIVFDRQIHTTAKLGIYTGCENLLDLLDMSSKMYKMNF